MLLLAFSARRKSLVGALFALSLAAGMLEGAFVLLVKAALEGRLWHAWGIPFLLLSATVTLRSLAQISAARLEARGVSAWIGETRRSLLDAVAARAFPAYRGPWRNSLVTSLGEGLDRSGEGAGAGLRCLAAVAQAAVLSPLLLLFSWKLALAALALAAPALLAARFKAGVLAAAGERWSESHAARARGAESFAEGLEDSAGNGRLAESAALLDSGMDRHAARALALDTARGVFPPALEWVFFMSLAGLFLFAGEAGEKGPEGLLPFGALLLLIYRPIREWARHYPVFLLGGQAWRRVKGAVDSLASLPFRVPPPAIGSGIVFDGVDFGYASDAGSSPDGEAAGREAPKRMVFRGLALRLDPEELTWLPGPNGSGKSTLLKLLAGVEFPSAGTISLPAAWPDRRRPFAYLPQRAFLEPDWEGWARAFRAEHPGEWAALAQILGLDAILAWTGNGPGPRGLSGGERQRLCLARVFASQAPYLLLDEPTTWLSAADRERVLGDLLAFWRDCSPSGYRRGGILVSHEAFVGEFCSRTVEAAALSAKAGVPG